MSRWWAWKLSPERVSTKGEAAVDATSTSQGTMKAASAEPGTPETYPGLTASDLVVIREGALAIAAGGRVDSRARCSDTSGAERALSKDTGGSPEEIYVHASSAPALTQASYLPATDVASPSMRSGPSGLPMPLGPQGPTPPPSARSWEPSGAHGPVARVLQTHGSGPPPGAVGFVGRGPFWTCGTAPRQTRAVSNSAAHIRNLVGGAFGVGPVQEEAVRRGPSGCLGRVAVTESCGCIDILASVLDVSPDSAPPDEELTTVLLETKEQRLQWRDFLSEAAAKACAAALFASYDVGEPSKYTRPHLSKSGCPSTPGDRAAQALGPAHAPGGPFRV